MKYKDEFQDSAVAGKLAQMIESSTGGRNITIMEVCGTHTMAIRKAGLPTLLPSNVRLISGPGCPVCVTANEYVDKAIAYARHPGCTLTTFGDMFRVPGSSTSLAREKAEGADIQFLYSPRDALAIAASDPEKKIIFFGIGFETTTPTIAATVREAAVRGISNFFIISAMKVIPNALKVLADTPELKLDGFLLPGHLSTITGTRIYDFLPQEHNLACAVSGFEPLDILYSIYLITEQIRSGLPKVENQYNRIVREEGNVKAQRLIEETFDITESNWRGIGEIPESGLRLKMEYGRFDAERMIPVTVEKGREHPGCICGSILRGLKTPIECPLYKKLCTPETPIGACMVSSEGTCAAYYKYVGDGAPAKKELKL